MHRRSASRSTNEVTCAGRFPDDESGERSGSKPPSPPGTCIGRSRSRRRCSPRSTKTASVSRARAAVTSEHSTWRPGCVQALPGLSGVRAVGWGGGGGGWVGGGGRCSSLVGDRSRYWWTRYREGACRVPGRQCPREGHDDASDEAAGSRRGNCSSTPPSAATNRPAFGMFGVAGNRLAGPEFVRM